MKWINLWIKNFADYIYTNCLQFTTTTDILDKSKKYQGVKEKKHDFEISVPSCRMCCTIMVHRSTNYKMMFLFTNPLSFDLFVQNHCYGITLRAILYKYNI